MKLTAEQRIERAHVRLMQNPDFCLFSGVFMVGKVTVSDTCKTAATNGRDVVYGREFVEKLNDKQLAFLVVHEAMHKAYRHLTVWKHLKEKRIANYAMDYVINLQIRDADPYEREVAMPRDEATGKLMGCFDEKYRNMDTKQVYDLLMEECESGGGQGDGESDGEGQGGNGHGQGQNDAGSESPDGGMDEHDWDGAQELTQEEKEELNREIDSALREGAMLAGKMKGRVPRGIDEILHPKVDWKEALREFIKTATRGGDQSTWRRPNRRYLASGIVMPSAETYRAECFAIGIDTSGSIGGPELGRFLGELKSICDEVAPEKVELLYWDSHVAGRETYSRAEQENLTNVTKPRGGGGTTPECVPKFMKKEGIEPQCVVMLTDGYFYGDGCGDWSDCTAPVLWCVVGNTNFVPTVGQSVLVE
jgi:predicted metal-dependent peptidase